MPPRCRYGGLYADLDLHPVATVDELLRDQTLLLPHTPNIGLTNAVMASVAGHPFLAFALRELPRYAIAWHHTSKHNTVLTSTGSTFIWAMHMRWAREHEAEQSARLVPAADWGKCSYCQLATTSLPAALSDVRQRLPVVTAAAKARSLMPRAGIDYAGVGPAAPTPTAPTAIVSGGSVGGGVAGEAAAFGMEEGSADAATLGGAITLPAARLPPRAPGPLIGTGGRWRSPLAHGEGSSWHSGDSFLVLLLFCHLDLVVTVGCAVVIYIRCRSTWRTVLVVCALLLVTAVHHHNGVLLFEVFVGRPWIWLIMT